MRLILFGWFFFGKMWKNMENGRFSGRLRPDWGNTARAATAGLGSKGFLKDFFISDEMTCIVMSNRPTDSNLEVTLA